MHLAVLVHLGHPQCTWWSRPNRNCGTPTRKTSKCAHLEVLWVGVPQFLIFGRNHHVGPQGVRGYDCQSGSTWKPKRSELKIHKIASCTGPVLRLLPKLWGCRRCSLQLCDTVFVTSSAFVSRCLCSLSFALAVGSLWPARPAMGAHGWQAADHGRNHHVGPEGVEAMTFGSTWIPTRSTFRTQNPQNRFPVLRSLPKLWGCRGAPASSATRSLWPPRPLWPTRLPLSLWLGLCSLSFSAFRSSNGRPWMAGCRSWSEHPDGRRGDFDQIGTVVRLLAGLQGQLEVLRVGVPRFLIFGRNHHVGPQGVRGYDFRFNMKTNTFGTQNPQNRFLHRGLGPCLCQNSGAARRSSWSQRPCRRATRSLWPARPLWLTTLSLSLWLGLCSLSFALAVGSLWPARPFGAAMGAHGRLRITVPWSSRHEMLHGLKSFLKSGSGSKGDASIIFSDFLPSYWQKLDLGF